MRRNAIAYEALWLISCYGVSFLLLGFLIGYRVFLHNPLDIQMHNTYFVISNTLATLPLFVIIALVVASARMIAAPLRTPYTQVVWWLLGPIVLVSVLLIALIANKVVNKF
jgi:hypothetical protein